MVKKHCANHVFVNIVLANPKFLIMFVHYAPDKKKITHKTFYYYQYNSTLFIYTRDFSFENPMFSLPKKLTCT